MVPSGRIFMAAGVLLYQSIQARPAIDDYPDAGGNKKNIIPDWQYNDNYAFLHVTANTDADASCRATLAT